MLRLFGALAIVALCIVALGFYRGWFSVSGKTSGAEGDTVKVGLTVHGDKAKQDVQKLKDDVSEIGEKAKD